MANENKPANADVCKNRLLNIPMEEIGKPLMEELFAAYHDRANNVYHPAQFEPTDAITLTPEEYPYVKEKISTTLGRLFFNRCVLERSGVIKHIGYYNTALSKKGVGKLEEAVVNLLITDAITIDEYASYIDNRDRVGFWSAAFLSISITSGLITPMKDVEKRKQELFKQNKADLESDSPVTQIIANNRIEKELMGMVRKNLENDVGYDMYASGDGNLDNNYKTINVMRGAVMNEATHKYDIVESSLMNGIKKKDIAPFANSNLAAAYPSAIGTAEAGYIGKIFMAVAQEQTLDPNPNSDCKTKVTIPVTITDSNKRFFLYRNFNVNGKVVLSNQSNIDQFVGKVNRMYSPQCCLHEKICAKCAGQIFYKMGVHNIGLLTTDASDALLNLKLKAKHDLSQKAGAIPKNYVFGKDVSKYADTTDDGYLVTKAKMKAFIPRMFDDFQGFVVENTIVKSMGIFPVAFYDKNDKELIRTTMIIPCVMSFFVYSDVQETPDNYIITYEPNSKVCSLNMSKSYVNCEYYINQVYLYSSTPQIPYHLITEFMWRCLELNATNFQGISLGYELLARALCKSSGNKPFAMEYGKGNVDPMSYTKMRYRESVQRSGVLQGIIFEDVSKALTIGLSQTLNGIEPKDTPLEQVIRA